MGQHPSLRLYPPELRERAVRMAQELIDKQGGQRVGVVTRVARELGIGSESLRGWLKQAEIDAGRRQGTSTADKERIAQLECEVRELRRADDILKAASDFFATELDGRRTSRVHRRPRGRDAGGLRWGVEPIRQTVADPAALPDTWLPGRAVLRPAPAPPVDPLQPFRPFQRLLANPANYATSGLAADGSITPRDGEDVLDDFWTAEVEWRLSERLCCGCRHYLPAAETRALVAAAAASGQRYVRLAPLPDFARQLDRMRAHGGAFARVSRCSDQHWAHTSAQEECGSWVR
jgi:transposase